MAWRPVKDPRSYLWVRSSWPTIIYVRSRRKGSSKGNSKPAGKGRRGKTPSADLLVVMHISAPVPSACIFHLTNYIQCVYNKSVL